MTPGRPGAGCFIVSAISKATATAGAAVATPSPPAPSRPDLRQVVHRLPRRRKPSRSTAVQETR